MEKIIMNNQEQKLNEILQDIAETIDISPSKYKQAVDRYSSVGKFLEGGNYPGIINLPKIYVQGSFRLGTVVRPIKNSKDGDYDIDLVCQMPILKENATPKSLKHMVRQRIKEKEIYENLLCKKEGRRCWTLEYAEEDGVGFHMDILPSIPMDNAGRRILKERLPNAEYYKHSIDITELNRNNQTYSWTIGGSNPEGFAQWFDNIKLSFVDYKLIADRQKKYLFENTVDKNHNLIFASVNDVPEPLIRTPLQQVIQILKHYRDLYFKNNPDDKPISMIITTLCARYYSGEQTLYATLTNIVKQINNFAQYIDPKLRFSENVKESQAMMDLLHRCDTVLDKPIFKINGKWWIPNPVNPAENFADRWDANKAKAFFEWLRDLNQKIEIILKMQNEGLYKVADILIPLFGDLIVRNAFALNAKRKREGLNLHTIKTSAGTGILSMKGDTNNIKHTFHH
jgi:hypothetical protein